MMIDLTYLADDIAQVGTWTTFADRKYENVSNHHEAHGTVV